MNKFVATAVWLLVLSFPFLASAGDIEITAKQALLLDVDSGTVLYAKKPETEVDPGSLAKLMTLEVMFHKLKNHEVSLEKEYTVSEFAWRTGGAPSGRATMFAKVKSTVPLQALLEAIAVVTANDACLVIAEAEGGSDAGFATLMNERAKAIGLEHSHFVNSTGAPDPKQRMSLRDLVKLSIHLIHEYPEYYSYFSLPSMAWNNIEQRNRNPLLTKNIGVDGLLYGFSEVSGFMISASASKNGQRLLTIMAGLESKADRAKQAQEILVWGFGNFEKKKLFDGKDIVGQAKVYGGEKSTVNLTTNRNAEFYLPVETSELLDLRIAYDGPLQPPIGQGDEVARLQLLIGEHISQEIPLYAAENVETGSLSQRSVDGMKAVALKMWQKIPFDAMLDKMKNQTNGE